MAFCIRSERKIGFENKAQIPGPGQYFKISPKLILNNKRKIPPFLISAKRAPFVKSNDIPGPGSYNLDIKNKTFLSQQINSQIQSTSTTNIKDDNNFHEVVTNFYTSEKNSANLSTAWNYSNTTKINNFSKDKAIQNSKLYKITETFFNNKINNNFIGTNIGFLSQTTRFNETKKDELSNLGPGSYYDSILTNRAQTEKRIKNKIKTGNVFGNTGSSSRVVSIPSKTMNGYIYKKDNTQSANNSFMKNTENNNDNLSLSSTMSKLKKNQISAYNLKNSSKSYNNINNEENEFLNEKSQLFINERKFGNTTTSATSEFIGPGTYDVSLYEKKNKLINWSRGFEEGKDEKKNNLIEKVKLLEEEMKKNSEEIPIQRTFHGNIKKLYPNKNKILLLYNLHKIKNNILKNKLPDSTRSSFIPDKSSIPGPGYYDKEIIPINPSNKKNTKIILEQELNNKLPKTPKLLNYIKYQFNNINKIEPGFGSLCERSINKSKSLEDLSPFSYFQEKNKYDPGKKNTLYKNIILGKTGLSRTVHTNYDFYTPNSNDEIQETDFINSDTNPDNKNKENKKLKKSSSNFSSESQKNLFKNFDNYDILSKLSNIPLIDLDRYKFNIENPGPGEYELSHKFIIPTFSHNKTIQSKSQRFKKELINENPGPGTYQLSKDFEKKNPNNNKKIFYKKTKVDLVKEEKIKKVIEKNKKKNEIPGVGMYNLDKKNSLVYKVHLKYNKKQGYNSPFLISSSRFKRQKNINEISAADYDPYKFEKIQKNNQFMVFNKSNRFNKTIDLKVGPGSYNLNPEWNKKSYNRLFSPNKK